MGAILLMCSNPEAISAGLPRLRRAFSGTVGPYPNLGYNPTGPILNLPMLSDQKARTGPVILQNAEYYPSRIAEFALNWKQMGAQIIGGCCASEPEHISHAAGGQRKRRHLIGRASNSGIRWKRRLSHSLSAAMRRVLWCYLHSRSDSFTLDRSSIDFQMA